MLISNHCVYCQKPFVHEITPAQQRKSKRCGQFCSMACHKKDLMSARVDLTCPTCGTYFQETPGRIARGRKYCSVECGRVAKKGRPLSAEHRKALSDNHADFKGSKSPSWRGGKTSALTLLRNSDAMQDWKKKVFERDVYQCGFCGQVGLKLQADHIMPASLYAEKALDIANGQTLCKPCHKRKTDLDRIWYDNFRTRL